MSEAPSEVALAADPAAPSTDPEPAPELTEADKLRAEVEKYKGLARKHETRAKENWDWRKANEEKVASWDALDEASKTEAQRDVDRLTRELAAEREARAAERRTANEQLVYAQIDAAAASKGLTSEQLRLLAGDASRFFGDEGLDRDAIDAFLDAVPSVKVAEPAPLSPAALGGGNRKPPTTSGLARGAELYDQMHRKRTPA